MFRPPPLPLKFSTTDSGLFAVHMGAGVKNCFCSECNPSWLQLIEVPPPPPLLCQELSLAKIFVCVRVCMCACVYVCYYFCDPPPTTTTYRNSLFTPIVLNVQILDLGLDTYKEPEQIFHLFDKFALRQDWGCVGVKRSRSGCALHVGHSLIDRYTWHMSINQYTWHTCQSIR